MLFALDTTNRVALVLAALAFIAFALLAAFVLPRYREEFPGKNGVKPFVIVSLVLFVIMIGSIELFAKEKPEPVDGESTAADVSGDATKGKALYTSLGCISCHALDKSVSGGPGFGGLAGSEVKLADGSSATADEEYLIESIESPDAKIVDGFTKGVMSSVIKPGQVSEQDAADLAAFIAAQ